MSLNAFANESAQRAARQRIQFDAIAFELECMTVALALGRPRRQSMISYLLSGERNPLDEGRRAVIFSQNSLSRVSSDCGIITPVGS